MCVHRDEYPVRLLLLEEPHKRREKAVDGVRMQSILCSERAYTVVGSVDEISTVEQHELHVALPSE